LAGGYTSSSGPSASGGTCIGNCYGGGGAAEMCPACLTAGEIDWNVALVMTTEDMRRRGHLPNGTPITDDFWGLLEEDIDQIIEVAYLGATDDEIGILIQYAKYRWRQQWEKDRKSTTARWAGGPVDEQVTECQKALTTKQCAEMLEAGALLVRAQKYWSQCAGPYPGDSFGWVEGRCQRLVKELGLTPEQVAQLALEKTWEEFENFWTGVYQAVVEDFAACFDGSALGCVLAATNFVPGGALARAGRLIAKFPKVQKAVVAAGAACRINSFVPGTLVLMADGSRKPIEDVRVEDEVLATDPATGELAAKKVTDLINSFGAKNLIKITVRSGRADDASHPSVIATSHHRFWVPSLQRWVDATYLQPGTWLRTSTGTWIQVADVRRWTASQLVYNLTVADMHTYYVTAGATDLLVHNDNNQNCISNAAADDIARSLGYTNTRKKSASGAYIWENKKAKSGQPRYITWDRNGHSGGIFKGASFRNPFQTTKDAGRDGTYDLLISDNGHLLGLKWIAK
ncbi:toxin C-terminal domain-containing protein, partial [Nonomuraea sp. KM90]|uniref:toxin C-terminal domain-containing protein n=1 Tax=Nonomuraea sp. KM90 TaxID=3457428 RepID=UPI003FCD5C17